MDKKVMDPDLMEAVYKKLESLAQLAQQRHQLTHAAAVCLVGKHWDNQSNVQSVVSAQQDPD